MKLKNIHFVLLFVPMIISAQFVDDFSNGNFTEDPPWVGDHELFVVDNGMLRLFDDDAGMAWLSTESQIIINTQWDFWVRMAFTPSDNNHSRVYLASNEADLSGPLDGYFIQVGKTGGDMKRLFFYRQQGEETVLLMTGSMNLASGTNNILRIRVIRDGVGNWAFYADPSGGNMFLPQGSVFDNIITGTSWFGVRCTYTASNSRRFYFDDFRVGDILPEDPPQVERIIVDSPTSLDVVFNRVVNTESATQISNYFVDRGVGHPLIASKDPDFPNVVRLLFVEAFELNQLYHIEISGVQSVDGQEMAPYLGYFVYYASNRFDVVFNEIMANSRPVVGLPPHDWVELYNTTDIPINLEGWTLKHGTTIREIPEAVILPAGYLVLTTEEALPFLAHYGNIAAIPGLSANAFTIGGTLLVLRDQLGEMVSYVRYSDRWYRDQAKSVGGWSLEKIDPYNFCQGAENWRASNDVRGGSPGITNSIRAGNPNTVRPDLVRAGVLDSVTVMLHFSEPMEEDLLRDTSLYSIDHHAGNPIDAIPVFPEFSSVQLTLGQSLQPNIIYELTVSDLLVDCAGNTIRNNTTRLAVPGSAVPDDIVINEILFNPPEGGARYVELYNRSAMTVDLFDLLLASFDTLTHSLITVRYVSEESYLLFPGDYLLLTNDTAAVSKTFPFGKTERFWELQGMPRMTNADGVVVLATRGHVIIDKVVYNERMHLPFFANNKGVALERIHPDRRSADESSWHSAASAVGYGTPGYRNSQYNSQHETVFANLHLEPKIFSPDGSGIDDVLHIYYQLEEPGFVANVRIFDQRGREVKTLASGVLLSTSGAFSWDGSTNAGEKASIGIYAVYVELFNVKGRVERHRLAAVLAGRL
ncbi:MAG: hypothetical protein EA394_05420 [Bacteroidia bacterium]|nr:MAG: hypothetical protein EA394_05420 [Bacteroidia bacterium]